MHVPFLLITFNLTQRQTKNIKIYRFKAIQRRKLSKEIQKV